ncbi:MAG: peptidoglycan-binding protein, partial [Clostridiales bacterium]|nr:peptidoglycan-binding protein [Clostridiales bacterium]
NVEMCKKVLKSAWEQGFEIENHTWSHCGLYNVDDDEMAAQIWRQNAAVSEALGVDYQMHFLRPRGGDNRYDQRTHAYMRQLGYYGIAYWTQVGLKVSANYLDNHAQPGNIILYHTTDEDLRQLKELVPRLSREGYTFVTLNELYGLPANETAPLSDHSQVPALASYTRFPQILRREDYLHDVLLVQKRLSELGYLDENYNGYYGKDTEKAVRAFQQDNGLQADGLCGQATWNALFGGS